MCMIRAAYLTPDSVSIKEMCYYIKLYSNAFTSTNKHFNTWKRNIVYPRQELKIQTKRVTKTIWSSPSQTADAEAALYDQRCSHVMTDYSVIMKLSYQKNLAHTGHMVGWERLSWNRTSWKKPDGCPSSKPLPTKHMTNRGERKEVSHTREHQKPTPLNKSVE
jgi:hypothetical protein